MGDYFAKVSETVQNHLKQLVGSINLPEGEDGLDVLAKGWLEKEESFLSQMKENKMEEVETFGVDEARGGLIMTYSGSLLTIGPVGEGGRRVEYASVGLRTDVPESAEKNGSLLKADIRIDEPAEFQVGPIKKSSPVYKIAVFKDEMEVQEEEELLAEVTQMLTDEFIEVNKTLIVE